MKTDLRAPRDQVVHQPPPPLYFTKQLVVILCRGHCLSDYLNHNYPITEHITLGGRAWHWGTGSLSEALVVRSSVRVTAYTNACIGQYLKIFWTMLKAAHIPVQIV